MPLNLKESIVVNDLAALLYNFLPGSGNARTSFPLAANEAGVADFWQSGSKLPSIVQLLSLTLEKQRSRFCPLISAIVRLAMTWRRGRGEPLLREEIEKLNLLLLGVSFRIPSLSDSAFLSMLPSGVAAPVVQTANSITPTKDQLVSLSNRFIEISNMAAQPRGYEFEKFLSELFGLYNLAPRSSFRNVGEQIDGSFALDGATYLLEARWRNEQTDAASLHSFNGKVDAKNAWARGLFVSFSGFSDVGLIAFSRAKSSIICVDGLDLNDVLSRKIPFDEMLIKKARRAVEAGMPFVRVRDLYPT